MLLIREMNYLLSSEHFFMPLQNPFINNNPSVFYYLNCSHLHPRDKRSIKEAQVWIVAQKSSSIHISKKYAAPQSNQLYSALVFVLLSLLYSKFTYFKHVRIHFVLVSPVDAGITSFPRNQEAVVLIPGFSMDFLF